MTLMIQYHVDASILVPYLYAPKKNLAFNSKSKDNSI